MIVELDDFGCDHVISDKCQSHDCRDQLLRLKELNPAFKATLFAIPAEMTMELQQWCGQNSQWIELAVHGFLHSSNYECEKWDYDQMDAAMSITRQMGCFNKIFRAPGWQISDDCLKWLLDHNWVVADQSYNNDRRSPDLNAYINTDGVFSFAKTRKYSVEVKGETHYKDDKSGGRVEAYHGHTWNVGWNGIYEDYDKVADLVKNAETFQFVSELFR